MGEDFFLSSTTNGGKMARETIGLTTWVASRLVAGLTLIRHSMRNGGELSILTATRALRIGNTVQSQTRWDQLTSIAVVLARGRPTVLLKADRAMIAKPRIIMTNALLMTTVAAPVGD